MHPHAPETTNLTDKQRKELDHIESLARGHRLDCSGWTAQSLKLGKPERLAFEQAKKQGYLVAGSTYKKVRSIWFLWCRATAHPYVIVTPRRRYAAVDLDVAAYADIIELTPEGMAAARELLRRYTEPGKSPTRRHGYLSVTHCSRELVEHMDVPVEDADELALELIELAKTHTAERRSPWKEPVTASAPADVAAV